jgi:hypothetical protein
MDILGIKHVFLDGNTPEKGDFHQAMELITVG